MIVRVYLDKAFGPSQAAKGGPAAYRVLMLMRAPLEL